MRFRKGQVYVVVEPWAWEIQGYGSIPYELDDEIELLEHTTQDPNNTGKKDNWVVRTKYGVSVWTRLKVMIELGHLKLKG